MSNQATILRKSLGEKEFIYTAGAYDALSAIIIEKAGFDAVFTSGYAISASHLGLPDAELYTMTENLTVVEHIVNSVNIPVIVDADTGYGNAINVMRTVKSFEKVGAAGLTLEDQVVPKRCPLGMKPELISLEEGVAKIKAAVEARVNDDFVIIARTDASGNEAIERSNAYVEAGADFVQLSPSLIGDINKLIKVGENLKAPMSLVLVSLADRGYDEAIFRKMNAKFIHFPLVPLLLAASAVEKGLNELINLKTTKGMTSAMMNVSDFKELIGFPEIEKLQQRFLGDY